MNSISYNGVEGLCRRCPILDDKGNLVCCLSEVIVTTHDNERIEELLHNLQQLKRKVGYFIAQETTGGGLRTFDDLVGDTSVMQALKAMGKRFARSREPVLILGESGTGKELFAQAIHKASPRANGSFISVNCAALPRELAESELFGYVEGAFTGARKGGQKGKFELADKGTIFLDEIGELPLYLQAKLLRVLESNEIQKIGMSGSKYSDFRLIAATNRKDILDPALLRPGRFDRQIYVGAPDWRGRAEILQVHARKKPLADNVDLPAIAKATAGFTGADLANLLNEGALLAARNGKAAITQQDLETAMIKVIAGPEKKSRVVSHSEKMLTAVHEAGHAVCMYCLDSQDPVHLITIIPRAQAGGMTISLPQDDKSYASRNEMFETIVSFLGGRVAESLKLCDISTGASNDLQRATKLARDMVATYGMSDAIGPVSYSSSQEVFIGRDYEKTKPYSEATAGEIDAQVQVIMREAYKRCEEILATHSERLDKIAGFLMENENMNRTQFEAIMQDESLDASES